MQTKCLHVLQSLVLVCIENCDSGTRKQFHTSVFLMCVYVKPFAYIRTVERGAVECIAYQWEHNTCVSQSEKQGIIHQTNTRKTWSDAAAAVVNLSE